MTPLRVAWEALNEDCSGYVLIPAWCFFFISVMIELMLPVALGYAIDTSKIQYETNMWLHLSTYLFGTIFDKLAILLGLFCVASTYTKVRGRRKSKND